MTGKGSPEKVLGYDSCPSSLRSKVALRLKLEVCKELRAHFELLPEVGYIQAMSSFSVQLKFLPRCEYQAVSVSACVCVCVCMLHPQVFTYMPACVSVCLHVCVHAVGEVLSGLLPSALPLVLTPSRSFVALEFLETAASPRPWLPGSRALSSISYLHWGTLTP